MEVGEYPRVEVEVQAAGFIDRSAVWIELVPTSPAGICDGCGRLCSCVHETKIRHVRDLPIFEYSVRLRVHRRRMLCPNCGATLERLTWLERSSRQTVRLAESVAWLCKVMTVKHVAEHYGLHRGTVRLIDKRYLQRELGPADLSGVRLLAMDEFAIQKGHRYATVIVDPACKQVLWIGRGRGRVDEANRLRDNKPARQAVKSARWILLRNKANLKGDQKIKLRELLAENRRLMTVYVLKDDLKHLWEFKYEAAARRFWKQWYSRAIPGRIEPLKTSARLLMQYVEGIFTHCRDPLNTSQLEGINNKTKVIKRMAYGYRDDEYFFLKSNKPSPVIRHEPKLRPRKRPLNFFTSR